MISGRLDSLTLDYFYTLVLLAVCNFVDKAGRSDGDVSFLIPRGGETVRFKLNVSRTASAKVLRV